MLNLKITRETARFDITVILAALDRSVEQLHAANRALDGELIEAITLYRTWLKEQYDIAEAFISE